MIKAIAKLGLWCIIGAGSIYALLENTTIDIQTPWKYTLHSVIPAGTQLTLTQPNGEPMTMSIPEGEAISGSKTFDVGAPVSLVGMFVLKNMVTFGLKARRRVCGAQQS